MADTHTFIARLTDKTDEKWGHAISVPVAISDAILATQDDRRVRCTLDDIAPYSCALIPGGEGSYFILVNKSRLRALGKQAGSEVRVQLTQDDSPYGMPMPEELGELLALDPEGNAYFHALTPGKQRSLIYQVSHPKRSETRLRKAVVIVEFLKTNHGKLDFKALNEAHKAANGR